MPVVTVTLPVDTPPGYGTSGSVVQTVTGFLLVTMIVVGAGIRNVAAGCEIPNPAVLLVAVGGGGR
jgi:hypothetical protein